MSYKKQSNSLPPLEDSSFFLHGKTKLDIQKVSPSNESPHQLKESFSLSNREFIHSKKELQQLLDPFNSPKTLNNDKLLTKNNRKSDKFIILPDFYIGPNLQTGKYIRTNLSQEKYTRNIKIMNEIDSKNLQLSRETYYSGYEQEIINNLKFSARESQKDDVFGKNTLKTLFFK